MELANLQAKKEIENALFKLEELSKMLVESEEMVEKLLVQTKFLKDEIRNHERIRQREENYKNIEYLKNVILKYMQTHNEQLAPVIGKLLQFSPEEVAATQRALRSSHTNGNKSLLWF